jgi:hypothetical protein
VGKVEAARLERAAQLNGRQVAGGCCGDLGVEVAVSVRGLGLGVLEGGGDGFRGRGLEIEAGGGCDQLGCRRGACGLGAPGLEALATEDGPALRGLEGDRGLDVALGALSAGFCAGEGCCGNDAIGARACTEDRALCLAGLAALGVVLELFIQEEDLLTGSEDKLTVAIYAGKKPVNELCLHRILRRAEKIEQPVWADVPARFKCSTYIGGPVEDYGAPRGVAAGTVRGERGRVEVDRGDRFVNFCCSEAASRFTGAG